MYMKLVTILFAMSLSLGAIAQEVPEGTIREALKQLFQDIEIDRIEQSQIPGLFLVTIGAEVFYVSGDGKYLLRGDLIDLVQKSNLSEQARTVARVGLINKIPAGEYIEFAPEKPEYTVYVFTDITCGFCQKLQHDIADINAQGIAVRYLAFPRDGSNTTTSKNMESIWCAEDRPQAFSDAMIGLGVKPADCENPVNRQFALGQAMGVRGTPAIFTEDGRYLPGYLPPAELLRAVRNDVDPDEQ
jgi:thiol:disulfide interchange protein DsbC